MIYLRLFFWRIYQFSRRYINYRMGGLTAAFMGVLIGLINADHGWLAATTAGLKQSAYTFLFGGLIIKSCENLAVNIKHPLAARLLAALIPSLITIGAVFFVHSLRGTPKPLASTVPTMILAPSGFTVIAWRTRGRVEQEREGKDGNPDRVVI
ncbi:MAG: hypothetical protein HC880_10175 [Bacteroidia bacterium]|nr:hypothetical protein [Bacteroidia bacterium]